MPDHNVHGWTLDTLYIHVMEISKAAKEGVNAAMASAEKAILKAETATEKRFDSVNEFRSAMKDQQAHFADKEQTDFRLTAIDRNSRKCPVRLRASASSGRSSSDLRSPSHRLRRFRGLSSPCGTAKK